MRSDLDTIKPTLCRCGCGQPAINGTEVEAAQIVLMRTLADRLRITAALENERGHEANDLLQAYDRAMAGLDGYVHQDWSRWPMRLGCPTTAWVEWWRRRVLALIEKAAAPRRFWHRRSKT